jgi:hypothetical protein
MNDADTLAAGEYDDYRGTVGDERQLWENNGWSVRGRDDSTDYLLWVSPYVIQGLPAQSYKPGRLTVNQTLLITHDADAPPELVDNDFIAVGWDPQEYLTWDDLTVGGDDEINTWDLGGRRMTAAPPRWRIDGEHAGVSTELTIEATTPAKWFTDPQEGLDRRSDRWWIANGEVEGRISTASLDLDVRAAHGVHERHIHCGLAHDPVTLLAGAGIVWFTVTSPELSGYVMARPTRGSYWAQFDLGGRTVSLTDSGISCTTTRTWVDPATNMVVGQTWHIVIEHEGGTIALDIQAKARAYYMWNFLSGGSTILYWWLCTAEATIEDAAGRRTLTDLAAEAHLNRSFYQRHGAADD